MDLAVVILNWNAATATMGALGALVTWARLRPGLWVVDNHSSDGSAEFISLRFPEVSLVCNTQNMGFGGGNNRGITQVLSLVDVPILLLNNDASIDERDVWTLLDALHQEEQLGCIGPLIFDTNDEGQLLSAGGRDVARYVHTHITRVGVGDLVRQVDYVPGTVALIRPEVFRRVGLFDEDYFFSCEMADLCERARQQGYGSAIHTRARAVHARHDPSSLRQTLYTYYSLRNRFLFVSKFRARRQVLFYSFWTVYGFGMALKALLRNQPARARAVSLAVLDGLRGHFGGQNERVLSTSRGLSSETPSTGR